MKYYGVELNYPLDPNVESGLYNEGVYIKEGNYGDFYIIIETDIPMDKILSKCKVDIKAFVPNFK
jgi:hypothetical protein